MNILFCAFIIILFCYDIVFILYLILDHRKLRARIHELEDMNDSLAEALMEAIHD